MLPTIHIRAIRKANSNRLFPGLILAVIFFALWLSAWPDEASAHGEKQKQNGVEWT